MLAPGIAANIATASLVVLPACYAYWALTINRTGEEAPVSVGHVWSPSQKERLLRRLEEVNASLLVPDDVLRVRESLH
jgi:hypothetical protein